MASVRSLPDARPLEFRANDGSGIASATKFSETISSGTHTASPRRRSRPGSHDRTALANLESLPHISIAGACATGTHGSGAANGSLATAVRALEMVTANGELVTLDSGAASFAGAAVSLGSSTAFTLATWIFPASSMVTEVLAASPASTTR